MGKLQLVLLVGTGMWSAYCMSVFLFNLDLEKSTAYNIGGFGFAFIISVPFFVFAYWYWKDKNKPKKSSINS